MSLAADPTSVFSSGALPGLFAGALLVLSWRLCRDGNQAADAPCSRAEDRYPVLHPTPEYSRVIPYIPHPVVSIFGLQVQAFQITLTLAVVSFVLVAERLARRKGLPIVQSARMAAAALALGGIGSYLTMLLAYFPEIGFSGDWRAIAAFGGMSSTGALFGGHLGAWLVTRRYWSVERSLQFQDAIIPAYGVALTIGRAGCALAHDHLGVHSDAWFAVDFPGGPQLDMGLIECVLLIPITVAMFYVDRHARRPGTTLAFGFICHGVMRFVLDFWRVDDKTYFGLMPSQYLSVAFVLTALLVLALAPRAAGPTAGRRLEAGDAASR
ncbi:prolipoprotein diacylglyceryl transferase [Stagnimonas aquatica]|uniref:prolipoprotein diacylglyceryl transferase n=1 Tax=Stagnimonas aquatica TaxID=2689987 RepID=UPI0013157888|nr:prolipoprotein diacylglyceryl transferase family protein [Stagnimonas aquatica]